MKIMVGPLAYWEKHELGFLSTFPLTGGHFIWITCITLRGPAKQTHNNCPSLNDIHPSISTRMDCYIHLYLSYFTVVVVASSDVSEKKIWLREFIAIKIQWEIFEVKCLFEDFPKSHFSLSRWKFSWGPWHFSQTSSIQIPHGLSANKAFLKK